LRFGYVKQCILLLSQWYPYKDPYCSLIFFFWWECQKLLDPFHLGIVYVEGWFLRLCPKVPILRICTIDFIYLFIFFVIVNCTRGMLKKNHPPLQWNYVFTSCVLLITHTNVYIIYIRSGDSQHDETLCTTTCVAAPYRARTPLPWVYTLPVFN